MEPTFSRRQALQLSVAGASAAAIAAMSPTQAIAQTTPTKPATIPRPSIKPRSAWATNHPVKGTLKAEQDVRFLLIHHSASSNSYSADEAARQIQSFYNFHTSSEKGWPDVAYNFFVDRFGIIWEARQGSIAGAVQGDATGGSQGHAMLCCFIGNHQEAPISPEARNSMVQLLAWLGDTYNVDTSPGATATFTSRGSNKWPQGQSVTARTISAHREMSLTSCPGDFAFNTIRNELPEAVTKVRNSYATAPSPTTQTAPSSTAVTDLVSSIAPATTNTETTTSEAADTETALTVQPTVTAAISPDSTETSRTDQNSQDGSNAGLYAALLVSGGAATALTVAAIARRKNQKPHS